MVKALGIFMVIAGLVLNYIINRRRFNRGGGYAGGAQWFNSYESYWFITFIEKLGKVIVFILILFGLATIGKGME